MLDAVLPAASKVVPFSLKDAPALIERIFPAQKISVETKREFDAHGAQTLTGLGSYWKGRKRLVHVRSCVLGALLPATDDPEADLEIFEKLMAIDERAFLHRERSMKPAEIARLAITAGAIKVEELPRYFGIKGAADEELTADDFEAALEHNGLVWKSDGSEKAQIRLAAYAQLDYLTLVSRSLRPEELPDSAYDDIWPEVNAHLGTSASSLPELVEQLGIMRFGHRPRVGDTFCGAGSIPFEAARIGCDVYASDLNPIACMLTWGALHLIGGGDRLREKLTDAQRVVSEAVDRRLTEMGVEHDKDGNRAKAFLYCVEVRCPATGWIVPLLPSLVISRVRKTIARLVPDHTTQRFEIEIESNVSNEELLAARVGTVQRQDLVYQLDDEEYRIPLSTIRGDKRKKGEDSSNNLRLWEKDDIVPRPDDILGERLYCIQWMTAETLDRYRPTTFFAAPTADDIKREQRVLAFVRANLANWQERGFIPDMMIEPGAETARLMRERGWTHWHHLFTPRQLMVAALIAQEISLIEDNAIVACLSFDRTSVADKSSRLSQWRLGSPAKNGRAPSADSVEHVFYNQALNTFLNYGARGFHGLRLSDRLQYKVVALPGSSRVDTLDAKNLNYSNDIYITDPPYADAVNYHEITEYFIAWLRRNPPAPFSKWVWDSRRAMAIKGDGDEFRQEMVRAYKAMAEHMPDNGLQIVMFTHQSGAVWADIAGIMWAAGLKVTAAWYISTEVSSEMKKGGYVQGTVQLVLRKRFEDERAYEDELAAEIKREVVRQIETLTGLNQKVKARQQRDENLFEDADLQMAGYAAALRVLTGYRWIGADDMAQEALRPRRKGEITTVDKLIEMAVGIATEHLIPEGLPLQAWERRVPEERFYLKMLELEAAGVSKLDNYQNFAKAYRVADYQSLMGDMKPNAARLKTATELRRSLADGVFGKSIVRSILFAIRELAANAEGKIVLHGFKDAIPDYWRTREDERLVDIVRFMARKTEKTRPQEAAAARILAELIANDHL